MGVTWLNHVKSRLSTKDLVAISQKVTPNMVGWGVWAPPLAATWTAKEQRHREPMGTIGTIAKMIQNDEHDTWIYLIKSANVQYTWTILVMFGELYSYLLLGMSSSQLTNKLQSGWNHQPVLDCSNEKTMFIQFIHVPQQIVIQRVILSYVFFWWGASPQKLKNKMPYINCSDTADGCEILHQLVNGLLISWNLQCFIVANSYKLARFFFSIKNGIYNSYKSKYP